MNKNKFWRKGFVFVIIFLFIGVSVYPAIAQKPIKSINIIREKEIPQIEEIDQKEYLFQTIFDIAKNPDVKDLLENNYDLFTYNLDYKSAFRQIFFKNPLLFLPMLFSRPKLTDDYLDSIYKTGLFMINSLGEDKAIEIRDSILQSNSELFDEVHKIIIKDEYLSDRISTLAEMNIEINSSNPIVWNIIICLFLIALLIPSYWAGIFFYILAEIYKDDAILRQICLVIMNLITLNLIIPIGYLAKFVYNCGIE